MEGENFKSKLGIIAATAGSAVGLGNLWSFTFKAGTNGGGNFVLLYIFSALFIGIPVMLVEFIVGREGRGGPVGSIEKVTKSKKSPFLLAGYLGAITTFLILSFYSVIAGWSLHYLVTGLFQGFGRFATIDSTAYFVETTGNLSIQVICQLTFVLATALVVMLGIQNGIEKLSKILMPMLFVIIIILVVYSVTLPGFKDAVSFLFKPSALPEGKTIFDVFTSALGQAFFSLSLGMGAIVTYARAVSYDENITTISLQVVICDMTVALLAGLATFPIIFSFEGLAVTGGPGLAFMALPVGFSQMPFGYIFGNLFFLLLLVAALTSSISMLENTLTLVLEKTKLSRKSATVILSVIVMFFGLLSQYGIGYTSKILAFTGGSDFLDQLDKLTMNYFIPIGALIFILLVGFRMDKEVIRKQINNDKISNVFIPYVKFVCPILVGIVLISGLIA